MKNHVLKITTCAALVAAIVSSSMTFTACSNNDKADTDAVSVSATPTDQPTDTPSDQPSEQADEQAPVDKQNIGDSSDSQESGAKSNTSLVDSEGNEVTSTLAPPNLDDYPEGAYFDTDGAVVMSLPDGSTETLWSPISGDMQQSIAEHDKDEQVTSDPSLTPSISVDDQIIYSVDSEGYIYNYLDSSDPDFIKVYEAVYHYAYDVKCNESNYKELLKDTQNWADSSMAFSDEEIATADLTDDNEEFKTGVVFTCAFDSTKKFCRMIYFVNFLKNDSLESEYAYLNLYKDGDKWILTHDDNFKCQELFTTIPRPEQ